MVVHCMVVWLTGIQYLHVPAVQRTLTVVRLSQEFYEAICKCRILFSFVDSGVQDMKQVAGDVSMTPGAVMSGCCPRWIVFARVYTGVQDTWCVSMYKPRKAVKDTHFDALKLGDPPPTCERAHSSFVLLTTAVVAVTTHPWWFNARCPVVV